MNENDQSVATAWERFVTGSSGEAAIRFAELYAETGDQVILFNLGLALLDDGNFELARDAFDSFIKHASEVRETGELEYVYRGLIDWARDQSLGAVKWWKKALSARYADDAGGVTAPAFLWYAGTRLKNVAMIQAAEERLRKFQLGRQAQFIEHWPGSRAIAAFLLGEVDAITFVDRWKFGAQGEILEIRRQCRAAFWVAAKASDSEQRQRWLVTAIADKRAILECEYAAAKIELSLGRRLDSMAQ